MALIVDKKVIDKYNCTQEKKIKRDISQSVYDPRTKFHVYTDNPALILAEILIGKDLIKVNDDFWESIAILADYCDERI